MRSFILLCLVSLLAVSGRAHAQLSTHVDLTTELAPLPTWSYTLFNDEIQGSTNYLSTFTLTINAPVTITGSPDGWNFTTDNMTYVYWFNQDATLPYPHDIAPGASLGGFTLSSILGVSQAASATITAWDHLADAPGPSVSKSTLSPYAPSASTPEPQGFALYFSMLAAFGVIRFKSQWLHCHRKGKCLGQWRWRG
jgi:hypothetical protein